MINTSEMSYHHGAGEKRSAWRNEMKAEASKKLVEDDDQDRRASLMTRFEPSFAT